MNRGQLDKLERRVGRRLKKGVPFDLWDHEEQMFHAFYVTGQHCPSSGALQNMQVTEHRKRADIERLTQ